APMRLTALIAVIPCLMANAATAAYPWPHELPRQEAFPDALAMFDGTKVATAEDWHAKRRPELRKLFQHYMYGRYPAKPKKVSGKVLFEDREALGGKGVLREVELTIGPPEWP